MRRKRNKTSGRVIEIFEITERPLRGVRCAPRVFEHKQRTDTWYEAPTRETHKLRSRL